ncbi:MAG: DNA gyrase inhibitor YacG [Rhodospirillaceae bacterium]|nr:DNA gyrase inhibitor YacG [Rhodospirillaceae bacterium]
MPVSCPVCGKPAEAVYRPFCSRRCADVDLGRWFNEDYRIPAAESDDETDTGAGEDGDDGAAENPPSAAAHPDAGGGAAGGLARGLAGTLNL